MDGRSLRNLQTTSKQKVTKRQKAKRFCVQCRNHGKKNQVTGHKFNCPFQKCDCDLCNLTNYVKTVSLKERKFHKELDRSKRDEKSEIDLKGDMKVNLGIQENIIKTQYVVKVKEETAEEVRQDFEDFDIADIEAATKYLFDNFDDFKEFCQ